MSDSSTSDDSSSSTGLLSVTEETSSVSTISSVDAEAVERAIAAMKVPKERLRHYRQMFIAFDEDHTGEIAARDLKRVMRSIGQSAAASDLHSMMKLADTNANGMIDAAEFVHIMELAAKYRYKQLLESFHVFDENNDGNITQKEFYDTLSRLGMALDKKTREAMFKKADVDKNNLIDFDEFLGVLNYSGSKYSDKELEELKGIEWTDFEEDDAFSDPMSVVSQSPSVSLDLSNEDIAPMDPHATVIVQVVCFYLEDRFTITCRADVTVTEFIRRLAVKTKEPVKKHRLYYEGFHMDPQLTLHDHNVFGGKPVWLVYDYIRDRLDTERVFDEDGLPNIRHIYHHFRAEGLLKRRDAVAILKAAIAIMDEEPNVLEVKEPAIVVGDIHGQFYDLAEIFEAVGMIDDKHNWVFLGDYVDRGAFSAECYLFLLAAKIRYPNHVHLLRGNHESIRQNEVCGSMIELTNKYGEKCYHYFAKSYYVLPLAAVIESAGKRFLACHGGLSPDVETLDDYNSIDRKHEVPRRGPLKVTLWSDPFDDMISTRAWPRKWNLKKLKKGKPDSDFESDFGEDAFHPSERGPEVLSYGYPAVAHFLRENNLVSVFRGHEQKKFGYECYKEGEEYDFPSVITIFSAPNYTDKSLNLGAVGVFKKGVFEIITYSWRLHPQYFPPTEKKGTPHPHSCEKCLHMEDFLQFVHWLHPESLQQLPIRQLRQEYKEMFEKNAADHGRHMGHDGAAADATLDEDWNVIGSNLMDVLQLSRDSNVKRAFRRRSTAMLMWYQGYDHFYHAVEEESEYEMDSDGDIEFDPVSGSLDSDTGSADGDDDDGGCCTIM